MILWSKVKQFLQPDAIDSANWLENVLESRAAYLVQKSITEYSQARANMMFTTLISERGFQKSYERARWHAYPAGLAMVAEVVAGEIRRRNRASVQGAADLVMKAATNIVARFPLPAETLPEFWSNALKALDQDLARAALAETRAAHAIVKLRAREIFEVLPFHASIREHDFDMFSNTLAFHLTEIASELEEMQIPALGEA